MWTGISDAGRASPFVRQYELVRASTVGGHYAAGDADSYSRCGTGMRRQPQAIVIERHVNPLATVLDLEAQLPQSIGQSGREVDLVFEYAAGFAFGLLIFQASLRRRCAAAAVSTRFGRRSFPSGCR